MSEADFDGLNHDDCIHLQALLYVAGELDGAELSRFEKRLGEDQEARDALCHATGLTLALTGQRALGPDPAYRALVHQRLFPPKGFWQAWLRPRWNHPAIWTAAGAVVLVLGLALSRPGRHSTPDAGKSAAPSVSASHDHKLVPGEEDSKLPSAEAATFWSELPNGEHLSNALRDDQRRKVRAQDFENLSKPTQEKVKNSSTRPAVPSIK